SSPAATSADHCARKRSAILGRSITSTLLSWVQRPVVVQLVLPVRTRRALPVAAEHSTTNLLWTLGDDWPLFERSRSLTSSLAPPSSSARSRLVELPLPIRTWP